MQRRVEEEEERRPEPVDNEEGHIAEHRQSGQVETKQERLWREFGEFMIRVPGTELFFCQLHRVRRPTISGKEFTGGKLE